MIKKANKNKVKVALGMAVILLTLILTFLYWYFSIGKILEVYDMVDNLTDEDRAKVQNTLVQNHEGLNFTKGIMLNYSGNDSSFRAWIWNYEGFKYFKGVENVKFSSFSMCEDNKWNKSSASLSKNANIKYSDWSRTAHKGDYVEIVLTSSGYIEEIVDYDWWAFIPLLPYSYFEQVCKN